MQEAFANQATFVVLTAGADAWWYGSTGQDGQIRYSVSPRNLHELGVSDIGIKRCFRHEDIGTTRPNYIKTSAAGRGTAMRRLKSQIAYTVVELND